MVSDTAKTQVHEWPEDIVELELCEYAQQLNEQGLTILPPEVTGVTEQTVDHCVAVLLERFEQATGCPITLEDGPLQDLSWPQSSELGFARKDDPHDPTQALLQQLLKFDRCFRDLAVNQKVDALVSYMMGTARDGRPARRLSSANSFIKWQGDFGYGPALGLHVDQDANPLPWGPTPLTSNATWTLTDYTKEDGALAYVPGSHLENKHPHLPDDAQRAIAVEAPRGSCILFSGKTWHGAFPKQTPGLRLCAVTYYRHASVLPQENMRVSMADEAWDDCDDPQVMRELIGFDDSFPYVEQGFPLPRAIQSSSKR